MTRTYSGGYVYVDRHALAHFLEAVAAAPAALHGFLHEHLVVHVLRTSQHGLVIVVVGARKRPGEVGVRETIECVNLPP